MHARGSSRLLALFALLVIPQLASAEVIGVGLDWREKIYVQEFWKEGKAHYAVFNDSPAAVSLSVFPRKGGAALAGPWKLDSKGFLEVEAADLVGKGLIEFKLDGGKSLGLLDAPTEAPAAGKQKLPVANVGLNGSGGRQANLWTEQDTISFAAGGKVELRLSLPANAGVLMYDAAKLPGLELSSETLEIQRTGDKIKIDLAKPKTPQDRHALVLRFPATSPEEKPQPALIVVDGWLATPGGGGHGVTRGVIVVPAKK